MLIAAMRMSKALKLQFNRRDMDAIRDKYILIFGINSLVRRFDIASIVA